MGNQIYFKIAGYIGLDMLNMFAVTLTSISYSFLNKGRKVLTFENLMKKGQ